MDLYIHCLRWLNTQTGLEYMLLNGNDCAAACRSTHIGSGADKRALRQQHLRRVDIAQQQHTQPQLLREEITSVHSMRRTSTPTTTHSTMATTTTEDGMVVDKSEDETAEAKVAGGNCSQQKCNGGAPDQATDLHTSDGCGRGRSTTRSTTPASGRGRLHRRRQVEVLCSASSPTSSMTSGDGRS